MSEMLAQRPYLLRGLYDWIVDSECTPHIIVDATLPNVDVPEKFVENGKIVLNIAPRSVIDFSLENEALSFSARFAGIPTQVYVPIYAIEGIYARENGAGTIFPEEESYEQYKQHNDEPVVPTKASKKDAKGGKRPTLTVVK